MFLKVLILSNNTCFKVKTCYLDPKCCIIKGFKDIGAMVLTNINSDILTNNDAFITNKQDIIDAGDIVDIIILISYGDTSSLVPDNLEGVHNYILDINKRDHIAYIDFSDDNDEFNILNSEYKAHCKCYFKRECTDILLQNGFIPFPLSYCPLDEAFDYIPQKDIDIVCSFPQKNTGYRKEIIKVCEKLKDEGYNVVINHEFASSEEYYDTIRKSYITMDSEGYGEINHRFFEIISNKSLCFRQKWNVNFYKDYNDMIVEYFTPLQAYNLLKIYLNNKNKILKMIENAYNHYSKYHTPKKLAEYMCNNIINH